MPRCLNCICSASKQKKSSIWAVFSRSSKQIRFVGHSPALRPMVLLSSASFALLLLWGENLMKQKHFYCNEPLPVLVCQWFIVFAHCYFVCRKKAFYMILPLLCVNRSLHDLHTNRVLCGFCPDDRCFLFQSLGVAFPIVLREIEVSLGLLEARMICFSSRMDCVT